MPVTDSTASPMYRFRVLPPAEWDRLKDFGVFAQAGLLRSADHATIVVVETRDGKIAGSWFAADLVLLEGLHIAEEYRKSPAVARKLVVGMIEFLREREVRLAMTVTVDAEIAAMTRKAGFVPLPGTLHLLTVGGE